VLDILAINAIDEVLPSPPEEEVVNMGSV